MLFANDANKERAKAIVGNIHRMGITNTVVSEYDGRTFPQVRMLSYLYKYLNTITPFHSCPKIVKIDIHVSEH